MPPYVFRFYRLTPNSVLPFRVTAITVREYVGDRVAGPGGPQSSITLSIRAVWWLVFELSLAVPCPIGWCRVSFGRGSRRGEIFESFLRLQQLVHILWLAFRPMWCRAGLVGFRPSFQWLHRTINTVRKWFISVACPRPTDNGIYPCFNKEGGMW